MSMEQSHASDCASSAEKPQGSENVPRESLSQADADRREKDCHLRTVIRSLHKQFVDLRATKTELEENLRRLRDKTSALSARVDRLEARIKRPRNRADAVV